MGKKANERRRQIFDDLKQNGKLDKPFFNERTIVRQPRKQNKQEREPAPSSCCLNKYKDELPAHFRRCYGCPLTQADGSARV